MKNKSTLYHKTHPLPLNVFLVFYVYVFIILVIANILPASTPTYFIFLVFGIIGICILLMRYKYYILIDENIVLLSMAIPFKVSLLKLKIKEIRTVEEITIDQLTSHNPGIKKFKPSYTGYFFTKGSGIKLTMNTGKTFTFSSDDARRIITLINEVRIKAGN